MANVAVFDSRYWPGTLPANHGMKGFLGKATEGYAAYTLVNHLLYKQAEGAKSAGLDVGGYLFYRYTGIPKDAARIYRDFMKLVGNDFPPIVDVEDTLAPKTSANAQKVWATVQEVEAAFGEQALIYSANWAWNGWGLQNFLPQGHAIYLRALWESDPPPNTPEPGFFGTPVGVQYQLDYNAPGYGSSIDLSGATCSPQKIADWCSTAQRRGCQTTTVSGIWQ